MKNSAASDRVLGEWWLPKPPFHDAFYYLHDIRWRNLQIRSRYHMNVIHWNLEFHNFYIVIIPYLANNAS